MEYKMLFTPIKIGTMEVKNRIAMSPMLMGFGQFDGQATDMLMDYYEERAKGGTGLIMTEICRINDKHGAAAFAQLGMSQDYQIPKMKEFADRIHSHGAKLVVQLHHPGRQNVGLAIGTVPLCIACTRAFKKFPKMLFNIAPKIAPTLEKYHISKRAVSASACEPAYYANTKVRALSHREVKQVIQQYVDGAVRCKKAGVDGVELHGTHGYLIQQFLSPNTNQRTDEYGGSEENRLRFLKEIVEGIRKECGEDYPIIVRLSIDEFYSKKGRVGDHYEEQPNKGYDMAQGVRYAKAIEAMGVNAIDVSSAGYDRFNYWLEPTSFELGWRKYLAAEVKKAVKIPVIAANLIRTPEQAEKQLQEGVQDMVSLGRPHIADPYFAEKAQNGRENEIKRCICCLYCIQSMQDNAYHGDHGYCSVNPTVGREKEAREIRRDGKDRTVVVVGAGVAGLTCAEFLARRGFKPVVLEKAAEVGGQIQLANKPPKKEKLGWCFEDMKTNAEKFGAEIKLNTEATVDLIKSYNPYAVVIATGASAVKPRAIKGVDHANVYTTTEILSGQVSIEGKKVALIGSGMTGLETAELLVEKDNKVTIVEMQSSIAPGTWFQHLDDIIPKLDDKGTEYVVSHKLNEIDDTGVVVEPVTIGKDKKPVSAGAPKHIDADVVVLSLGSRPVNELVKECEEANIDNLYVIGDAGKIGRIADATRQAYDVATTKIGFEPRKFVKQK
ncbi:MAG: NAD(P)/FAD-dependent oxidoreductase [Clostridia bacterium]|nr:NAD(P)/FAD-dependent oxidoreductase [Clostridia bacterium]